MDFCQCDHVHESAVRETVSHMPTEEEMFLLSEFFKVFGDSTRIKIMSALEGGELCVCDIASVLGMTKSAISHQLKSLKDAKLVKSRKDGKNVFYSPADEHVKKVFELGLEHIRE